MPEEVKMISVREFERKVRALEEVSITIHAPSDTMVPDYAYKKKAASGASITDWMESRLSTPLGPLEHSVINAEYVAETPHGRTKMETLRKSYER